MQRPGGSNPPGRCVSGRWLRVFDLANRGDDADAEQGQRGQWQSRASESAAAGCDREHDDPASSRCMCLKNVTQHGGACCRLKAKEPATLPALDQELLRIGDSLLRAHHLVQRCECRLGRELTVDGDRLHVRPLAVGVGEVVQRFFARVRKDQSVAASQH